MNSRIIGLAVNSVPGRPRVSSALHGSLRRCLKIRPSAMLVLDTGRVQDQTLSENFHVAHARNAGSRCAFWPPDPLLEPEDGRIHLRPAQQDPYRQPGTHGLEIP